jgi:hypothetical protein
MSSPSIRSPTFHSLPSSFYDSSFISTELTGRPSTGPMQQNPITAFIPNPTEPSSASLSSHSTQLPVAVESVHSPSSFFSSVSRALHSWDPLASTASNSLSARSEAPTFYRISLVLFVLSSLAVFIFMIVSFHQAPPDLEFYSDSLQAPTSREERINAYTTSETIIYLFVWIDRFPDSSYTTCTSSDFQLLSNYPHYSSYSPVPSFIFEHLDYDWPAFGFLFPIKLTDDPESNFILTDLIMPDTCFTNYTRKFDRPIIYSSLVLPHQIQAIQLNQTLSESHMSKVQIRNFAQFLDLQTTIFLSKQIHSDGRIEWSGRLIQPIPSASQDKYRPQRRTCRYFLEPTFNVIKQSQRSVLELIGSMAGNWGVLIFVWQNIVILTHMMRKKLKNSLLKG